MCSMSTPKFHLIFTLLLITIPYITSSDYNITDILDSDSKSDFSEFNRLLTLTGLADQINSNNQSFSVLAVPNAALTALTSGNHSTAAIKNTLSLHILFDYYDAERLHRIKPGEPVTSTTLYQTTGEAEGKTGQVNVTSFKNGTIVFGSAQPGIKPVSKFVRDVRRISFKIAVVEISNPIIVPSVLTSGALDPDVRAVLDKAGCKRFLTLLSSSGVLNTYEDQVKNGITIFAPNDAAFKAKGTPDFSNLTDTDRVSLLEFHALSSYAPIDTLKSLKGGRLTTLAPPKKFDLTASVAGKTVTLHTGVNTAKITTTAEDTAPVVIYVIDSVLLPVALFGNSSAPAEAPAPEGEEPVPAPAPSPAHKKHSPSPSPAPARTPYASPPAPPGDGGDDEAADDSPPPEDDDGGESSGGANGKGSICMGVMVSLMVCWIAMFVV